MSQILINDVLGIATGLLVMALDARDRNFLLAVITAVGTVGAAGAALWTTRLSRETLNSQLDQNRQLRQPNLVLSDLNIIKKKYEYSENDYHFNNPAGRYHGEFELDAELTNLGEFPIYVKGVSISSKLVFIHLLKSGADGEHDDRGYLIPPNVSVRRSMILSSPIPYGADFIGSALISFQYGPTARKVHHLELDISIYTYDEDHVLVGYLTVKHGDDEVDSKYLEVGANYDRSMDTSRHNDPFPDF